MASERLLDCLQIRGHTFLEYLELLYEVCRDTDVDGGTLEIGCFMGRSTLALSRALDDRRLGETLTVIDAFKAPVEDPDLGKELKNIYDPESRFMDNMNRYDAHNISLFVADSQDEGAWAGVPGTLRFAHVDGDHSYEGVKNDLERVLDRTMPGSVVAVDDYHDRNWDWGVKRAVDELLLPRAARTWKTGTGEQILVEVGG